MIILNLIMIEEPYNVLYGYRIIFHNNLIGTYMQILGNLDTN
jgi:hypothetical protein